MYVCRCVYVAMIVWPGSRLLNSDLVRGVHLYRRDKHSRTYTQRFMTFFFCITFSISLSIYACLGVCIWIVNLVFRCCCCSCFCFCFCLCFCLSPLSVSLEHCQAMVIGLLMRLDTIFSQRSCCCSSLHGSCLFWFLMPLTLQFAYVPFHCLYDKVFFFLIHTWLFGFLFCCCCYPFFFRSFFFLKICIYCLDFPYFVVAQIICRFLFFHFLIIFVFVQFLVWRQFRDYTQTFWSLL